MPLSFSWQLLAPADHPCYPHHFAGDALVPGALLLDWVDSELQCRGYALARIKQLKFLQAVRPNDALAILIEQPDPAKAAHLTITHAQDQRDVVKGQVHLRECAHP